MHQLELTRANFREINGDLTSQNAHAETVMALDDHETGSLPAQSKSLVPLTRHETDMAWYSGKFGSVTIQKKRKYGSRTPDLRAFGRKPLAEETSIIIAPSFMRRLLELRLASSLGKVSRTLNVYPVLDWNAPMFAMCSRGDMNGLQTVFGSGKMSPFVLDDAGNTLLHVRKVSPL